MLSNKHCYINIYRLTLLLIPLVIFIRPVFDAFLSELFVYVALLFLCIYCILRFHYFQLKKVDIVPIFSLLIITFTDKVLNDFFRYNLNINNLLVFFFIICFVIYWYNIKYKKSDLFWRYIFLIALSVPIFLIIMNLISDVKFDEFNRDASSFLFIAYVIAYYYYPKYKKLVFIYVFLFSVVICTNRTILLSLFIFIVLNKILRSASTKRIKRYIILSLIVGIFITLFVVWFDFNYPMFTSLFTNRGVLWRIFIGCIIDSNNYFNVLFGLPTDYSIVLDYIQNNNLTSFLNRYEELVVMQHPHNGLVYIFYNSGLLGVFFFCLFIFKSLENMNFSKENFILFSTCFIIFLFYGRNFTSVVPSSILLLFSVIMPINKLNKV